MAKILYTLMVVVFGVVGISIVAGVGYLLYWRVPAEPAQTRNDSAAISYTCTDGSMIVALFERDEAHLSFSNGRTAIVGWTAPASVEGLEGVRYATPDDSLIFWRAESIALIEEGGRFTHGKCTSVEP